MVQHCKLKFAMNNKGQTGGLITSLVFGVASLVIAVVIAFVIITTIDDADLLDGGRPTITVLNEQGFANPVHANRTGYTLSGFNTSWSAITLTSVRNSSDDGAGNGGWNITVATTNITVSSLGVLNNATAGFEYGNISVNYTYQFLSGEELAVDRLSANYSEGIDNISEQIPTVLLVAAIVLILSVLAILVGVWQRMRMGGGSTL